MRTSVDLASMEGANEAGRLAARGVLRRLGRAADVAVFDFDGLSRFDLLRKVDVGLHAFGLPHLFDAAASVRTKLLASRDAAVARLRLGAPAPQTRPA